MGMAMATEIDTNTDIDTDMDTLQTLYLDHFNRQLAKIQVR
jgi:hypothetical protein